jgi:hypothetical protein
VDQFRYTYGNSFAYQGVEDTLVLVTRPRYLTLLNLSGTLLYFTLFIEDTLVLVTAPGTLLYFTSLYVLSTHLLELRTPWCWSCATARLRTQTLLSIDIYYHCQHFGNAKENCDLDDENCALSLSLSLSLSRSLARSRSLSLSRALSLSRSLSLALALSRALSLSRTHTVRPRRKTATWMTMRIVRRPLNAPVHSNPKP